MGVRVCRVLGLDWLLFEVWLNAGLVVGTGAACICILGRLRRTYHAPRGHKECLREA